MVTIAGICNAVITLYMSSITVETCSKASVKRSYLPGPRKPIIRE